MNKWMHCNSVFFEEEIPSLDQRRGAKRLEVKEEQ
jgi:hypothetical protein